MRRFLQEIDIYCGLKRFDESVIEVLENKFRDVDGRLAKQFPGLPDLHMVDEFELPKDKSIEAMFVSVTEQLVEKKLTDTERDDLLDDQATTPANAPTLLSRPEVASVALEWIATLRAYTIALKNLEEIYADKKAHHLRNILSAWGRVIGYVIIILRTAFDIDINIGGATLNLKLFGDSKSLVLRYFLIATPSLISGVLRDSLGTEKLRLMMAATNPAGSELATVRFLNEGLYLDLRLPEFLRRLEAFRKNSRWSSVFLRSSFCQVA